MRRLPVLLLIGCVSLAGCLSLAGCAGLADAEPEPDTDWEVYQDMLEEGTEEPAAPEPEYPAAFSLAFHKDHTLDPITCGEGIQEDVSSLLYEPLFQLDAALQPVPLLCESCTWDEQGLVCTLNLRQGVAFQDGSALTANDVAATLRRAMASERYAYRLRNVAAVAANRSGQVLITLTTPNQGLPALLDIPIVKSGTEDWLAPTGTGPYRFVSEGGECRLEADEAWWQQKALPVRTIPLIHAKDRDTARYLFSTRRVELLTVDPTDDLTSVTGQSQITDRPTTILQYIGFNTAEGRVFASSAARSAFSRGIDREVLVDAQLAGLALAAQFPISPLSELYPKDLERPYNSDEVLAALRTAGQDTGEPKELLLLVNEEDSFRVTSAQFIAEHLSLLDWKIVVQVLPWEEYLLALAAGNFDLYYGEVRLTADWDLTDLAGTAGTLNWGGFTNLSTDLLLQSFAAAAEGEARKSAARLLMTNWQAMVPIAPISFKNYTILTHPNVAEGLSPTPSSTFCGLENWTIHLRE